MPRESVMLKAKLRPPRVPEKVEQQHGLQLLRSIGARVYVLGTVRRRGDYPGTMQTPGVADVFAFLPKRGNQRRRALWWECKAAGGRRRPEQIEFQELCGETDLEHVVGTFDALIAALDGLGYVKATQFPHYRQPRPANQEP